MFLFQVLVLLAFQIAVYFVFYILFTFSFSFVNYLNDDLHDDHRIRSSSACMSRVSVNDDADLEMVQRAAVFSCVGTAGQRCTTTRRIVSVSRFWLFR